MLSDSRHRVGAPSTPVASVGPTGVPGVDAPPPRDFEEFWLYYVSQHLHPLTRAVHVGGKTLAVLAAAAGAVTSTWWLVAAYPFVGYLPAGASHFVIERNRPASFTNPRWAFRADYRQVVRWYSGRLSGDVVHVRALLRLGDRHRTLADRDRAVQEVGT